MKAKILITSATGKTSYAATVQLLNEGYPVRIFVRAKNRLATEPKPTIIIVKSLVVG